MDGDAHSHGAEEESDSEEAGLIAAAVPRHEPQYEAAAAAAAQYVQDRLSTASKLRFAVALQLNALPSDLVLSQGAFIFERYYHAPASMIGLAGTAMGFYNMLNGVPIANWADRGSLNELLPRVFPMETWGRRAPWMVVGLPLNSIAALMVLFPPLPIGSAWLPAWYALTLLVYFTGHTATTQQFYAIPQECTASKREIASLFAFVTPCSVLMNFLSNGIIPLLIYAVRPSSSTGGEQCCADPFTDCGVPPACGCYTAAAAVARLTPEYAAVCPGSEFATENAHAAACQQTDGMLGSVGLVALLVSGLSAGQWMAVGVARGTPMRARGSDGKTQPLAFFPAVKATLQNDSFRYMAAMLWVEQTAVIVSGVFFAFFLTYSVGVSPLTLGATLASVNLLASTLPVLTMPLFRHLLRSGRVAPWDLTKWTQLSQALMSPLYLLVDRNTLWPLYACAVWTGLSNGGMGMSLEMMRGWTMDDDEQRTGLRREGLLLSVNAVFQFFSTTVSLSLVGLFGFAGYDPEQCPFDQPDMSKQYARAVYIAFPALMKLSYVSIVARWPIKGKRLRAMEAWIAAHGQARAEARRLAAAAATAGSGADGKYVAGPKKERRVATSETAVD
jgi:Na+/melibiose symporter-like transporter